MTAGVIARVDVGGWLRDLLAGVTGFPVGLDEAPRAAGQPFDVAPFPYLVVMPIPGGAYDGPPLTQPDSCGWTVWQVDAVGARADQTTALADRANAAILGRYPDGAHVNEQPSAGFSVLFRETDGDAGFTPSPAGTAPNQVWTAAQRFRLYIQGE